MEEEKLSDAKLYQCIIETKRHAEDRRDEINKYYTSLFTAMVSVLPFINRPNDTAGITIIVVLSLLLSITGFILSISWILTLKRIYYYLEGLDQCLINFEKKWKKSFISYVYNYLNNISSPDRVTKYTAWVPYTFLIIFLLIILYFLAKIIMSYIAVQL